MSETDAPARPVPRLSGAAWLMLLLLSLLWAGSFLFAKVAVTVLPPFTVVFVRVSLAALALWLVVWSLGLSMTVDRAQWRAFFGMGFLNNLVPFSLLFWGQTQIESGLASILNATTPVFTVLVAHLLTRDEKATGSRLAGAFAGVAGVAVLMGPDLATGFGTQALAQLACLAAALSYAFAGVYGRRFKGLPPLVIAAGMLSATTVMLLPVMLLVDRSWRLPFPAPEVVAALLALALVSTAAAYILYFEILKRAGATNLLLVTLLIPPGAILLGWIVLGEALLTRHFLGLAVIAAGLGLIDGRVLERFSGRR